MSNIVVLFWLNLMLEVEYWWSTLVMLNLMLVMLNLRWSTLVGYCNVELATGYVVEL